MIFNKKFNDKLRNLFLKLNNILLNMKAYYHIIALVCACLGSLFSSIGLILMKIANIKNENQTDGETGKNKKYYFRTEWLFGAFAIVLQVVFNGSK